MIYDAFLFFNEFELLALRLEHMRDIVDRHIIMESAFTFTGNPKPYSLDLNHPRLAPYRHRIDYIQSSVDMQFPDKYEHPCHKHWRREFMQRDVLRSAVLPFLSETDMVFFCDLDQFPSHDIWQECISVAEMNGVACVEMDAHIYFLNRCVSKWGNHNMEHKGIVNNARLCRSDRAIDPFPPLSSMPSDLARSSMYRICYFYDEVMAVHGAGWHFSSMGGRESVLRKIASFSHADEPDMEAHRSRIDREFVEYVKDNTFECPISSLPNVVQQREAQLRSDGFIL